MFGNMPSKYRLKLPTIAYSFRKVVSKTIGMFDFKSKWGYK